MEPSILSGDRATIPSCHLLDLFDSHVQSMVTRDSPAILDDTSMSTMCYAELDRDSTVVANKLYSFVQSTDFEDYSKSQPVIAMYLGPSAERVVVMLAIWKLNAVFLPLDASMPTERMRRVLQHTKVHVVISSDVESRFDELKSICGELGILYLDYFMYLNKENGINFNNSYKKRPDTFATDVQDPIVSIYFTSGSTGVPKAVPQRTGNWLNLVTSYWTEFPFRKDDIGCHKTPIGFVEALQEILVCLLAGIPFVVFNRETAANPEVLAQKIAAYKISHISLVPSMVRAIARFYDGLKELDYLLSSLRVFVCNSEVLDPVCARQMRKRVPENCVLVNMYGSTEDTCNVTREIFHSVDDIDKNCIHGYLPVGRPFLNTTVYVLDGNRRVVEAGSQGYIFIGGRNLTDGYLGQSNSDVFTRISPLTRGQSTERVYNTGDTGFVLNGKLYFVGRCDNVVKVRGQKVNCTELEHVIYETNYVDKVVVLAIEDSQSLDAVKLVAFCTRRRVNNKRSAFEGGSYFSSSVDSDPGGYRDDVNDVTVTSSIEAHCRLSLPSYMLPIVVILSEFPLKPLSGKIDREVLRQNYLDSQFVSDQEEDPSSGREEDILRIIAQELQMSRSSLQKNMAYRFMDLGGNSLSAVSVVLTLRAKQYDVTIDSFISAPISDLLRIRQLTPAPSRSSSNGSYGQVDTEHEKTIKARFAIKMLREVRDQETVKRLVALAFTQKNPLDVLMGTSLRDFMVFLNSIWRPIVEDHMSFVIVDRQNKNSVVAAALNVNTRTQLDPVVTMEEVIAINEAVESPVKTRLAREGGRWMDAMLNAVDVSLPNNLSLPLLILMEEFVIELAERMELDGIVTVNSHPVTMALAEQKFGYTIENVLRVKSFQYGGRRPFGAGEDDYVIKCMTKRLT